MKHVVHVLIACLLGCGARTGFESGGGAGGAGGAETTITPEDPTTLTAPETTTTPTCATVAPDLMPVLPAPEDLAGVVVTPLPPFDVSTVCDTVVVGLYLNDDVAPCEAPEAIDLVHYDVETLDDLSAPPALVFVAPLPPQNKWISTAQLGVYELRFHLPTGHAPNRIPLVGAMVRANLCPVTVACVEPAHRYRTSGEWSTLEWGLYFGLADCALAQ